MVSKSLKLILVIVLLTYSASAACGDGVLDANGTQQCDYAINRTDNRTCYTNCTLSTCGDGILNKNQGCDDGNLINNDGCSSTCKVQCGNGILNAGEQCDDGNTVDGDGCSSTCLTQRIGSPVVPLAVGIPIAGLAIIGALIVGISASKKAPANQTIMLNQAQYVDPNRAIRVEQTNKVIQPYGV